MSKLLPRIIFPHNALTTAPSSDSLACPAPYNAITHAPSVVQPRVIVAPQCNHAGPLCRTAPHDRPSLLQDGPLNMRRNAMRRLDSPCAGMPCAGLLAQVLAVSVHDVEDVLYELPAILQGNLLGATRGKLLRGGLAHCVCLDGPQDFLALGLGIGLGTGLRIGDGLLQAQL